MTPIIESRNEIQAVLDKRVQICAGAYDFFVNKEREALKARRGRLGWEKSDGWPDQTLT